MNLNRAMIIGNLTRDPETRATATGQSVCNFAVATSSQWKDQQGQKQERTEYHSIVAWGKLAEICQQYLMKGKKVYVEGRLQTREWEGQDGVKKQRTEIIAENMLMLDRGPSASPLPSSATQHQDAANQTPAPIPSSTPSANSVDKGMGENEIRVEDIPF